LQNIMIRWNFEDREAIIKVVPLICFAACLRGMYLFFVNILFYEKNATKFIFIGTVTAAGVSTLGNIILIPLIGIPGAGVSAILASLISSVLIYFIAKRVNRVPFKILKMYGMVFTFFIIAMGGIFLLKPLMLRGILFCGMALIFAFLYNKYIKLGFAAVQNKFRKSRNLR
jgi:O-antigen/teichoic acid export membrane protein